LPRSPPRLNFGISNASGFQSELLILDQQYQPEGAFGFNADELVSGMIGEEQDFSGILRRLEEIVGVAVTHSTR
jgi:hypothetical protein